MSEQALRVSNRIEQAIERIEQLVADLYPEAASAIKPLCEANACLRDFDGAEVGAGFVLQALEVILQVIGQPPRASTVMPQDEFSRRARLLAADVMEISFDDSGNFEYHDIMACQVSARRLLTGVDEGPYTGRQDEEREKQGQQKLRT